MDLFKEIKPSFSGHETFPLRHGWLEKAYDAVNSSEKNPFTEDLAIADFGVGKNMVNAIKHWAIATGFVKIENENQFRVSDYARNLIDHKTDPYLENPDTMWKIHYELAKNPKNTTAHWLFSHFNENVFDRYLLINRLQDFLKQHDIQKLHAEKTLVADISVTLANYCSNSKSIKNDDDIGSPLSELKLISRAEDNRYVFNFGTKHTLSAELFLECLVNYLENESGRLNQNTIKFETLLHDAFTPGRIFLLGSAELTERLEKIEEISDGALIWSETAGINEVRKTPRYDPTKLTGKWMRGQ